MIKTGRRKSTGQDFALYHQLGQPRIDRAPCRPPIGDGKPAPLKPAAGAENKERLCIVAKA